MFAMCPLCSGVRPPFVRPPFPSAPRKPSSPRFAYLSFAPFYALLTPNPTLTLTPTNRSLYARSLYDRSLYDRSLYDLTLTLTNRALTTQPMPAYCPCYPAYMFNPNIPFGLVTGQVVTPLLPNPIRPATTSPALAAATTPAPPTPPTPPPPVVYFQEITHLANPTTTTRASPPTTHVPAAEVAAAHPNPPNDAPPKARNTHAKTHPTNATKNHLRKAYICKRCGQPKRGHKCTAPPAHQTPPTATTPPTPTTATTPPTPPTPTTATVEL